MARTRRRNKISKIEMRGEIGFKIEPRDNEIITITNALQITVPISGDRVPNKIQVNTVMCMRDTFPGMGPGTVTGLIYKRITTVWVSIFGGRMPML